METNQMNGSWSNGHRGNGDNDYAAVHKFSAAFGGVANSTSFPAIDSSAGTLFQRPVFDAIDLYVTPIWYIIGVPGNILAFAVWVQRRMRPSSGYFLAALALDECLFLIMQVE